MDNGLRRAAAALAKQAEHQRLYGDVRQILSVEHQGHRFVAVGDELHFDADWKTFPDFLLDYLKRVFGSGWGKSELGKPLAERHEVMRWYDHLCQVQAQGEPGPDGIYSITPDALCAALYALAYDLYVLRHHSLLQKSMLQRLRRPDHFWGARYELLVAATFIRAGFEIEYEDETDSSRKHPEFRAQHKDTRFVFELEAKSRHRTAEGFAAASTAGPKVLGLLRSAAAKKSELPLALCLEVAMPVGEEPGAHDWVQQAMSDYQELLFELQDNPFDLVFFTNLPQRYGAPGDADSEKVFYAVWPENSRIPEPLVNALGTAFQQYGRIPNDFPEPV